MSRERIWLQPGPQRLDGPTALGYSRSRVTTDDFSRMRRQRCMVAAVIDQAQPMTLLQRYPQIIGAVGDNVATDIPAQDLDEWATLTLRVQAGTMRSLPFTSSNTDTVDPNFSDIRARVYDALHATPVPPPPADDAAVTTAPADDAVRTDDAAVTTNATGELTLWVTSQNPHVHRLILAAFVMMGRGLGASGAFASAAATVAAKPSPAVVISICTIF